MDSKHRISVNLPEKDYQTLSMLAEKNAVSMAWLGRKAIEELLEKIKNGEVQLQLRSLK